jgi:hypothetical protein
MYANYVYPRNWTEGIIVPVPKKGNLNDVNNYRGITLTSIFSKIFSFLLDTRLRKWSEDVNLLTDCQYGFRSKKSTVDCIFVLSSIINKVIHNDKRKLYCAFIDFKKAFDVVYRNGIWYKLMQYGASTKIVNMLRKIYESVKSCVRVNSEYTDFFESHMGLKQGEPLSPLLFLFFINDMENYISSDNIDAVNIEELKIYLLLFADDTVLFSYTKEGLQLLLDKLHNYCTMWGITVNTDKSFVMICKKGNRPENVDLYLDRIKLNVVRKFTYLGVTLSQNGTFYQAQKQLSEQASRALFSLNKLFDEISLDVSDKLKLFDAMICPILNYGSEVWGFHKSQDVERIQLKFLKQLLGVRQQTCNTAAYGELARFPLSLFRKIRIIKYWFKIRNNPDSLMYKLLNMKTLRGDYINTWSVNVKQLLDSLGFSYLFELNIVSQLQIDTVVRRLFDTYLQSWYENLRNSPKLDCYATFKLNFNLEPYIKCINNKKLRIILTRFRCSAHKLNIEEGRYRNINRENRLCTKCNMKVIENEYHFLLVCPLYRDLRNKYLPKYYRHWPNMNKFINLLSCTNKKILYNLAMYLSLATNKRNV